MTIQQYHEIYHQSVYQTRLALMLNLLSLLPVEQALAATDKVIQTLLAEDAGALKAKYGPGEPRVARGLQ